MEMSKFFRAIVDSDEGPVVICDTEHTIVYMNPNAIKRYEKRGGAALIGTSLMNCHKTESQSAIEAVTSWFRESPDNNWVFTCRLEKTQEDIFMMALRDENGDFIGYYERHKSTVRDTAEPYCLD